VSIVFSYDVDPADRVISSGGRRAWIVTSSYRLVFPAALTRR
jgi:hypothetical protein